MRRPDPDAEADDGLPPPDATSREALTPRGGFMARPGLKAPPRHAVVIRGGDVPLSEDIPLVRGSHPPPAPASQPPPDSVSEKVTLRAIPTPKPEPVASLGAAAAPIESVPPLSDMPVVASVPAPESGLSRARRRTRSLWTIAAAVAAGLLLGFASIAATRLKRATPSPAPAAPAPRAFDSLNAPAAPSPVESPLGRVPPQPSVAPLPTPSGATKPAGAWPQKSIAPARRGQESRSRRSIF